MQGKRTLSSTEERLHQAVTTTGLSQKDFAEAANMPLSSLKVYLSGKKRPGFDALAAIVKTSGVSADWLLTGEEKDLSKLSTPDFAMLEQIIEGVEEFLEQRRRTLPPQKKAKVIALLYEHFYGEGEVDATYLTSMVRVAS